MRRRIECEISGRVQLVMYRDFAQRNARKFGIIGTAKNLEDGRVAVVAEGEEEALNMFIECLREGPLLAHVTDVTCRWLEPTGTHRDFSIIHD